MPDAMVTWSSGDEAVASVDENGLVTAVDYGMAEITAQAGDAMGTAAITVSEPVATSITIEPAAHTLEAIGATVQLVAVVLDQHEHVMEDVTVTWSSDDESVATVDENGLVTAVDYGMAEITAQAGDAMGTAAITVSEPVATSITIEPAAHTLEAIGATVQLAAVVLDQHEHVMEDVTVTWMSSDESVVTVDEDGLVEAVGNGMAEITAQAGDAMGTAAITVSGPVATSITIAPAAHTLEAIGATVQLAAVVLDQHEHVMEDVTVTWSSGDEAVVTVDEDGLVEAVGNGMAEVTAASGDVSAMVSITVMVPSEGEDGEDGEDEVDEIEYVPWTGVRVAPGQVISRYQDSVKYL